jgi:hypothetical protein
MDILGKGILFLVFPSLFAKAKGKNYKIENCTGQFVERFLPQP